MAGNWVSDPADPTLFYSQQRNYLLSLIQAGMTAEGDLEATARVQLDIYAAEVVDWARANPDVLNPFLLGKPGEPDA